MKHTLIIFALLTMTTTGCTVFVRTNPVSSTVADQVPFDRILSYQEKTPNSFLITVTRDEGFMGSGCFLGLEIEGVLAGRFGREETATFSVPTSTPRIRVIPDPLGGGLCALATWNPVEENYQLKATQDNYFRISLGGSRRPRLLPTNQ